MDRSVSFGVKWIGERERLSNNDGVIDTMHALGYTKRVSVRCNGYIDGGDVLHNFGFFRVQFVDSKAALPKLCFAAQHHFSQAEEGPIFHAVRMSRATSAYT